MPQQQPAHGVVPPEELTPEQSTVADEIRASRNGKLADLFAVMLHAPEVASRWADLGSVIRFRLSLEDDVREALIFFVAHRYGCTIEEIAHRPLARDAGVPASLLDRIDDWRSVENVDARLTTALAVAEGALSGATAASTSDLDAQTVVEIHALVAYYTAVSQFLAGMGLALPAAEPAEEPPLPEPGRSTNSRGTT